MLNSTQILKKYWGYNSFRNNQDEIIQSILENKDTLALLPTGGGKSICYQVPGIQKEGVCVVISPLIALMEDQVNNLNKKGIKAIFLRSGMKNKDIDRELDNCIYGNTKFLYVSPERIQSELFLTRFKQMNVNLLAIDESHCISQWGHDFRPTYLEIVKLRNLKPKIPIIAVTATATEPVKEEIINYLRLKNPNIFESSFERLNISYINLKCDNKQQKIIELCKKIKGSGIIYCSTRNNTIKIAQLLKKNNQSIAFYHGGMNPLERSKIQKKWINNEIRIIVATNAFGMGVDKSNVRFVIHYEIPTTPEAYFQEAGRAGRDGRKSRAVLLYQFDDLFAFQRKARQQYPDLSVVKNVYKAICNHLQVAYECGKDNFYDINLQEFAGKYNLSLYETYYSIKILELNKNIKLTENWSKKTRIRITKPNNEIYNFMIKNVRFEPLILLLTRAFPGIFSSSLIVNEYNICKNLKITYKDLISQLKQLEKYKIIDLELGSSLPQILFLENRVHDNYFEINTKIFKQRRAVMEEKLQAMARYVYSNHCRSNLLLEYFGQEKKEPCGKCDYCLDLNNQKKSYTLKSCSELMSLIEKNNPIVIYDLLKLTNPIRSKEVISKLEWLIENNHIWVKNEWISIM